LFSAEFPLAEKQSFETKFRNAFWQRKSNEQWLEKDFEKELFGRISYIFFECVPKSCFYRLFMSGRRNHWKSCDFRENHVKSYNS